MSRISLLLFSCFVTVLSSHAQHDPYGRYEGWEYALTLYGWFSSQTGDVVLGNRTITLSPSDYLTDLSWSVNAHIEMRKKPWSFIFDLVYHDERRRVIDDTLTSFTRMFLGEASAAYRLTDHLEGIAGVRYFNAGADLETVSGLTGTGSEWWIDPIIGGRVRIPLAETLVAGLRGDIGGFGISADFSWNLAATIALRMRSFSLIAGYRIWDTDYQTGDGAGRFRYNVNSHGPGFGLTFHL